MSHLPHSADIWRGMRVGEEFGIQYFGGDQSPARMIKLKKEGADLGTQLNRCGREQL